MRSRLAWVCVSLLAACNTSVADATMHPRRSSLWHTVEAKEKEAKLTEAATEVAHILATARSTGDDSEVAHALIEATRLKVQLGAFETAVQYLKTEAWPKSGVPRDMVQLYYAQSLLTYIDGYSWEIKRREKVTSAGADLKLWTEAELVAEATRAFADVWAHRSELDKISVTSLPNLLHANNYPSEVRGTLRDAISYLAASLFGNSSRWRPGQDAAVWQLDLGALLDGNGTKLAVKLDDPAVHPLQKAVYVLADLEDWQRGNHRRQAVLEAKKVRLQQLHAHFTVAADRARIATALTSTLAQFRDVPWWSMGKALEAEWLEEGGDLAKAHAVAEEGYRANRESVGGRACLHIVKTIEAPDFAVELTASDAAKQRSIQVTHKNLDKLYFRAWPFDLKARIVASHDYGLLPSGNDLKTLMMAKPAFEWRADLPTTPDYLQHRTFVTPPVDKPGVWLIATSVRSDFAEGQNHVLGGFMAVGDLVVEARTEGLRIRVRAYEANSGKPAPNTVIHIYKLDYQSSHQPVASGTTDAAGAADIAIGQSASYFLVAERNGDIAFDGNSLYAYAEGKAAPRMSSLIYTDRSVYRPQQTLMWKIVDYRGMDGDYKVVPKMRTVVTLRDPNNQEVQKLTVTTNEFGSASGQLIIPAGRPLGQWRVTTDLGGSQGIRVEEYKRPTFEVKFADAGHEVLRLGQPATVAGEAHYYFGQAVTAGVVSYRVERQPVYPWWWGWYGRPTSASQVIAAGTTKVDGDGGFKVAFTPTADAREDKSVSYGYRVSADLTDEGGETRSAERSFRLGWVTIEAQISSPLGFFGTGGTLTVARTNLDGAPRPGAGSYRILTLQQPQQTLLPADQPLPARVSTSSATELVTAGDKLRSRSTPGYDPWSIVGGWADGAEVGKGDVTHDSAGVATVTVGKLPPGAYRLRYRTTDEFGVAVEAWHDFIVADDHPHLALPSILKVAEPVVHVGETAHILAWTGIAGAELGLDIYRSGNLVEHRRLVGGGVIELPIKAADRGGLALVATLVRDHQLVSLRETIAVPWDDKMLDVAFSTFRDQLRPGAKETFKVTVRGNKAGQANIGAVEILAYMYDRSLDVFAPHTPPNPLSLYPSRAVAPYWRNSLGPATMQWIAAKALVDIPPSPSLTPDLLTFYSGYGNGGPGDRSGNGYGYRSRAFANATGAAPPSPAMQAVAAAPEPKPDEARDATVARQVMTAKPEKARQADAAPMRSNFAETAFFQPHLVAGKDGSVAFDFTVPDSVTSWNVWVHAITRDLASGSINKETRSIKELMVRPYLPRFFREGDSADLKVVVNNAGKTPLLGTLNIDILNESKASKLAAFGVKDSSSSKAFTVEPGKSTTVSFAVTAPRAVGSYAFQIKAKAGQFSDGELRPVPVLPSRLHLMQSRFVSLRDQAKKTLAFPDLAKNDDPTMTTEKLVVTVDAQLFYSMLNALPYLVEYPYECTEQTLNRFVSTAIVSSMQAKYPAIAKMSVELAARRTSQLERFDAPDPNRKMALEETPWLVEAQGGSSSLKTLKILDPEVSKAQRDDALGKLRRSQLPSGAFPWFAGGPPSPYITLYLLSGFAKAVNFGADVPKDMIVRAWQYLASYYRSDYPGKSTDWEFTTFLGYVASSFPDGSWTGNAPMADEKTALLNRGFAHWKQHSPYLKGMLAVTLKRAGRPADAKLVWDSVMDSAKTSEELGTYWAPEDRSWLWYNDTIESHAFALRVSMELDANAGAKPDAKADGMVLWLMLNKKLNHWKSTRATAEALYTLAVYLTRQQTLGIREEAQVTLGGKTEKLVFLPDHFEGKKQLVLDGASVQPARDAAIVVEKTGKGIMFASATWHFATDKLPAEDHGDFFNVSRSYFLRVQKGGQWVLEPIGEAGVHVGDEVEVHLSLRTKHAAEYVQLRDPRGAGFEPESQRSGWQWDSVSRYEEVRDSGANFFFERLPVGEYTFVYRLRANMAGTFRVGPASVQSVYAPEFNAYSAGHLLTVQPAK